MSYSNTGALWTNSYKKHDKQPDFKGDITLERALIKQLLEETDGDDIKIRFSAWNKEGRTGPYLSLKYDSYKPDETKQAKPEPNQTKLEPKQTKQTQPVDEEDLPF